MALFGTKSIFTSKTALTGMLLAVLGLLNALGFLPAAFDASTFVDALLMIGGTLVAIFRSMATQKVALTSGAAA